MCIPLYISDVTKTCNATVINRASNSNIRYGHCIPFRKQEKESLCDDFYTSGVDYIYVPNTRNNGRYSRLMKDIINFAPILLARLDKCYEPALRIICHFYLPPCGNSTSFELPTSVCEETCMRVQESCGQEWESVLEMFRQNRIALEIEGTAFIDCENTGKHLSPLPHNCVAMEHLCEFCINKFSIMLVFVLYTAIPTLPTNGNEKSPLLLVVAIPVGVIAITIALFTTAIITVLVCVRINRKPQSPVISNPTTLIERYLLELYVAYKPCFGDTQA